MLNLFRKKPKLEDIVLPEDAWLIKAGTVDNLPTTVRYHQPLKKFRGHHELQVKLGIAIPLNNPNPQGFVEGDEVDLMRAIEEKIILQLAQPQRVGFLAGVISTGGMQEFISYVRSVEDAGRVISDINAWCTTHDVTHIIENEPKWDTYTIVFEK